MRTDGSSRFGQNNKYGLFYSIGGGWNMSREEWLNDIIERLNNKPERSNNSLLNNKSIECGCTI